MDRKSTLLFDSTGDTGWRRGSEREGKGVGGLVGKVGGDPIVAHAFKAVIGVGEQTRGGARTSWAGGPG